MLSLRSILLEIQIEQKNVNVLKRLNELKNKNFFIHFTNNPQKIGINPKSDYGHINPLGYYGYPINDELLERIGYLMRNDRKYIVLFSVRPGSNIVQFDDRLRQIFHASSSAANLTKALMAKGIDAILSKDHEMSGDIFSEIVVFKASNVEVVDIMKNTIQEELKQKEFQGRLDNVSDYEKFASMNEPSTYRGSERDYERALKGKEYRDIQKAKKYYDAQHRKRRIDL